MSTRFALPLIMLVTAAAAAQEPPPVEVVPPPAAPPPAPTPRWYDDIVLHGFISFSITANFNDPPVAEGDTLGRNTYRAFDQFANTYSLDDAALDLQRPVSKPGDVGGRIVITTGQTVPRVEAANGSSAGPFDLQQALISWITDIGNGLRLDVGKFVSPVGNEDIENYGDYNDEYSHSFLFTFGPYTHLGLHVSYPFSSVVTANLYATNGWDVLIDNNTKASIGAGLNLTTDALALQLLYMGGPELAGKDPPWRHLLDVIATFTASKAVKLTLNADYAKEGDTSWYGAAGYAAIDATSSSVLGLRAEIFADPDGARTGVANGQTLTEITGTYTWKFGAHLVARLELRWDHSSNDVFVKNDGTPTASQVTLAANYLGMF